MHYSQSLVDVRMKARTIDSFFPRELNDVSRVGNLVCEVLPETLRVADLVRIAVLNPESDEGQGLRRRLFIVRVQLVPFGVCTIDELVHARLEVLVDLHLVVEGDALDLLDVR